MPDTPNTSDEFFDGTPAVPAGSPTATPTPQTPAAPMPADAGQPRSPDGTFGHKHPSWLLEDARESFFTEEEIAQTPTEQLGRLVRSARQAQRRVEREFQSQRALEGQPRPPTPAAPPSVDEGLPDLSHLDESVAETIRQTWRKAAKADKELTELRQYQQQTQQQSINDHYDAAFAALPEEYQEIFGKESYSELSPAEIGLRHSLSQKLKLPSGKLPPVKRLAELLKTAADEAYPKLLAKKQEAKPGPAVYGSAPSKGPSPQEWASGGVHRPSQRSGGQEPPGEIRATSNLRERMAAHGMLPEQEKKEVMDGFLP